MSLPGFGGFKVDGCGGVGMGSVIDPSMMRISMVPEIEGAPLRLFIQGVSSGQPFAIRDRLTNRRR